VYASDFAAAAGLFIPPPCSRVSSIQFFGQLRGER